MTRTAINLYSVRDLDEPLARILERVADAGYDAVQFSGGFRDATSDEARALVDDLGLEVIAPHISIAQQEDALEETVATYETLGCDGLVVPWLPAESFESLAGTERAAERLARLDDRLRNRGFELHYHNHDQEFTDLGNGPAFDVLLDQTELFLELDVGWAAAGGYDPTAYLAKIGDRGPLVHMKDVDIETGTPVEIGEGDVDMQACADAAHDAGAEWLVYEHDHPDDPIASIDHGASFLDTL